MAALFSMLLGDARGSSSVGEKFAQDLPTIFWHVCELYGKHPRGVDSGESLDEFTANKTARVDGMKKDRTGGNEWVFLMEDTSYEIPQRWTFRFKEVDGKWRVVGGETAYKGTRIDLLAQEFGSPSMRPMFDRVTGVYSGGGVEALGTLLIHEEPAKPEAPPTLVGDWFEYFSPDISSTHTFHEGGKYSALMEFSAKLNRPNITIEGTWRIEGDYLVYTATHSSDPDLLSMMPVVRDRILTITPRSFTYYCGTTNAIKRMSRLPPKKEEAGSP
jgi:hypothetical protein